MIALQHLKVFKLNIVDEKHSIGLAHHDGW